MAEIPSKSIISFPAEFTPEQVEAFMTSTVLGSPGVFGTTYLGSIPIGDDEIRKQIGYKNELKLLGLKHKNVVKLLGYARSEDHFYLVYRLIDGVTLVDKLQGDLTWVEAMDIVAGISSGIHYLQKQEPPLVHCDLSLDNIMISTEGLPKLIDFGLCVKSGQKKGGGKIGYMHRETDGLASVNTDVYSFGVVASQIFAKQISLADCQGNPFVNTVGSLYNKTRSIVSPYYGDPQSPICLKASTEIVRCIIIGKLPPIASVYKELFALARVNKMKM